jgi:Tol biopolymer transport system component
MNWMGPYGWEACHVVPYDGSSKARIVGPNPSQCTVAEWSPDGKWMYVSADTGAGMHTWRQRFPGGTPEQVTSGTAEEEGLAFAPDGKSFLTSIGTEQNKIWIHESKGDRQVTSEAYSFQPSFSTDGKKMYYIVRAAGGLLSAYGGLWVVDLESGRRQRLLPEYQMLFYNVSRDGKRVVFASPKDTGHTGVWLAPLDGSSAPKQLFSGVGLTAFFGANGEVFYSALDGDLASVYRVKEDGSDNRKALPQAIYVLAGVSPDGKYLAVSVPEPNEMTASGATWVYSLDGGPPVRVCICGNRGPDAPQPVSWSEDGRLFYISLVGGQKGFAVPLHPGQAAPRLPPAGIQSEEEAGKLPGAKPLPAAGEFPGPTPGVYAYPKFTAQRNIYRVPVR